MSDEAKPFFLPFVKKEQLTKDTFTFYFKKTKEARDFIPGQYFEIKLPHKNMDDRGDARVFTISSSPTNEDFMTITTRIIESTYKITLSKLKPNDMVQFDGPWNDLNFDESEKMPHVFLAGGIGVTPYHSIVSYAIDKNIQIKMTLFASWKNKDEMVFHDFFNDAQKKLSNFAYIPTITDESFDDKNWTGEKGRINEEMIKKYNIEINNSKFYIAGPPPMVKSLKEMLIEMKVPKENLVYEDFEGYLNDKF